MAYCGPSFNVLICSLVKVMLNLLVCYSLCVYLFCVHLCVLFVVLVSPVFG